jgi:hypothetical protein
MDVMTWITPEGIIGTMVICRREMLNQEVETLILVSGWSAQSCEHLDGQG